MKQIIAIVKPIVVEKVVQSLAGEPIVELVIREAKGFSRQKSYLQEYDDNEYSLAFLPKVEILIWAEEDHVDSIIEKMVPACRTGRIGDGKILVVPNVVAVDQVIEF